MDDRFVADRMLGRLARMLRLVGYDTVFSSHSTPAEVRAVAELEARVVLTRGQAEKRYPAVERVLSVKSDYAPEQLREVVEHFKLDPRRGLWTRCTLCNGMLEKVDKRAVKPHIHPKVFELYEEFFRCAACGHIYWRGSHVERMLKNLSAILSQPLE